MTYDDIVGLEGLLVTEVGQCGQRDVEEKKKSPGRRASSPYLYPAES